MINNKKDLITFIEQSDFMMSVLKTAKSANLPNWFIGAGFIRDTVWDIQHNFEPQYLYKDIDLAYFDKNNCSEKNDEILSKKLKKKLDLNWEIVNQAYAHKYNNVPPYNSAEDGLAHWVETATCVAAALDENDNVVLLAPWGIDDLLKLKLIIAPCHQNNKYYENIFNKRIEDKKWLERWPKLKIV